MDILHKKIFMSLLILLVITTGSCKNDPSPSELLIGKWRLIGMEYRIGDDSYAIPVSVASNSLEIGFKEGNEFTYHQDATFTIGTYSFIPSESKLSFGLSDNQVDVTEVSLAGDELIFHVSSFAAGDQENKQLMLMAVQNSEADPSVWSEAVTNNSKIEVYYEFRKK